MSVSMNGDERRMPLVGSSRDSYELEINSRGRQRDRRRDTLARVNVVLSQLTRVESDILKGRVSIESGGLLEQKLKEIELLSQKIGRFQLGGTEWVFRRLTIEEAIIELLSKNEYTELSPAEMDDVDRQLLEISPNLAPKEVELKANSFYKMTARVNSFRNSLNEYESSLLRLNSLTEDELTILGTNSEEKEKLEKTMESLNAEVPSKFSRLVQLISRHDASHQEKAVACACKGGGVLGPCKTSLEAEWEAIKGQWSFFVRRGKVKAIAMTELF